MARQKARESSTCDRKLKWEAACDGTRTRKEKSSFEATARWWWGAAAAAAAAAEADAGLRVIECAGDTALRGRFAEGEEEKETCSRIVKDNRTEISYKYSKEWYDRGDKRIQLLACERYISARFEQPALMISRGG